MSHLEIYKQNDDENKKNPHGQFLFYFEKKFYDDNFVGIELNWLQENWTLSIYYALVYLVLVYISTKFFEQRNKFRIYRSLAAWNIVLAAFSILGTIRFLPNFIDYFCENGFNVCRRMPEYGLTRCWVWFFILSKMIELIDTIFIVLRKQKLIFLHWYHHSTVLVYTWYSFKDLSSTGPWFIAMNFFVHSIMYSYYALRSLRATRMPKWVNVIITSLQISQMLAGILVNLLALVRKLNGESCFVSYENIFWSFIMYTTYFILFFHFFRNSYLNQNKQENK